VLCQFLQRFLSKGVFERADLHRPDGSVNRFACGLFDELHEFRGRQLQRLEKRAATFYRCTMNTDFVFQTESEKMECMGAADAIIVNALRRGGCR
jgi:hypothetical protein